MEQPLDPCYRLVFKYFMAVEVEVEVKTISKKHRIWRVKASKEDNHNSDDNGAAAVVKIIFSPEMSCAEQHLEKLSMFWAASRGWPDQFDQFGHCGSMLPISLHYGKVSFRIFNSRWENSSKEFFGTDFVCEKTPPSRFFLPPLACHFFNFSILGELRKLHAKLYTFSVKIVIDTEINFQSWLLFSLMLQLSHSASTL